MTNAPLRHFGSVVGGGRTASSDGSDADMTTLHRLGQTRLAVSDTLAIPRNRQAKSLGIAMGAPLHHIRDLVAAHGVRVMSSNYML